jgi:hypothetical protein
MVRQSPSREAAAIEKVESTIAVANNTVTAAYSRMSIFLPDPLTPEELAALKVVAVAPPLRGLQYKIQRRLVDLGFAETVRGGLIATEDGLLRIQLGLNENLRD